MKFACEVIAFPNKKFQGELSTSGSRGELENTRSYQKHSPWVKSKPADVKWKRLL